MGALASLGCAGPDGAEVPEEPALPGQLEVAGPVWTARSLAVARVPAPPWYRATLPEAPAQGTAPLGDYAHRICEGRDTTRDAWRRRVLRKDVPAWVVGLAEGCTSEAFCGWVADHLEVAHAPVPALAAAGARCVSAAPADPPPAEGVGWARIAREPLALSPEELLGRLAHVGGLYPAALWAVRPAGPALSWPPHREPALALFAWVEGRRYRALAAPGAPVAPAVGLINAVLEATERPRRVALVRGSDGLYAVGAPPDQLRPLEVAWADPPAAPTPTPTEWHDTAVDTGFRPDPREP